MGERDLLQKFARKLAVNRSTTTHSLFIRKHFLNELVRRKFPPPRQFALINFDDYASHILLITTCTRLV